MAISYRDAKRSERKRSFLGPILMAIAVIGGLYWFAPQSTSAIENIITSVLALPRY
jgi:hypothetical protein